MLFLIFFKVLKITQVKQLASIVIQRDVNAAKKWSENSENWATLTELFKASHLSESN